MYIVLHSSAGKGLNIHIDTLQELGLRPQDFIHSEYFTVDESDNPKIPNGIYRVMKTDTYHVYAVLIIPAEDQKLEGEITEINKGSFEVTCPECGEKLSVSIDDLTSDSKIVCPECDTPIITPEVEEDENL